MTPMVLYGEVVSVVDEKLMIVELQGGKQIFLPWSGANAGEGVVIEVKQ